MNILSQTIENISKNFSKTIVTYDLDNLLHNHIVKDFTNYMNVLRCIDELSSNFSIELYKQFLKEIDDSFFNSVYRKKYCEVINFPSRSLITFYGEVVFTRRYYYDTLKKKKFFFVDEILKIPKYCRLDPFVCAKICEISSHDSYAKAGRTVAEMIGKRLKFSDDQNRFLINRATARKVVMNFDIPKIEYDERNDIEKLYIMLDEKYAPSQFNNGNDWMIKAAVVFEDVELTYKFKRKLNSKDRFKLINKYVTASVDNDLVDKVLDYVYSSYDTDKIKEIVFMGDCAKWITSFPSNFKFDSKIKITFSIDGYHYSQTLQHICTTKRVDWIPLMKDYIKHNLKKEFQMLCKALIEIEPHRFETIENKMKYIINNWDYIQNYYHNVSMKCSMESNISHCFADIFTSRPRAYSYKGIKQLLKLRLLKINNKDINKIYFDVLNNEYVQKYTSDLSFFEPKHTKDTYSLPFNVSNYLNSI